MTSFLRDKELSGWWNGVVQDSRYEKVLTYARSAVVESAPERTELIGMERLLHILGTMSENEPEPFKFPPSGLHHEADKLPTKPKRK